MVTSLQQANDNRGNTFMAVRAGPTQIFALADTTVHPVAAFAATTKVVRVTAGISDLVRVVINGMGAIIIGRGIFQDFIVQPGDTMSIQLDPSTPSGNASVMELA